jgi:Ser/Thr protein kinase RdoA (MazF antagonist)
VVQAAAGKSGQGDRLLGYLADRGFAVPAVIPALDGRRRVGGIVVQAWLGGVPPGQADWAAVDAELRRLHAATAGWPRDRDLRPRASCAWPAVAATWTCRRCRLRPSRPAGHMGTARGHAAGGDPRRSRCF